jgi:hypothetical protein
VTACAVRCFGFAARPGREFAPAGDLLFERPKRRQKVAPAASPVAALGVPCDAWTARLAQNSLRYAAFKQLREVSPRSVLRTRLAVLRFSAPPKGTVGTAEQPTAKPESRPVDVFRMPPFSPAEERKTRSPRAKLASSSDSRRLFEQSVATRVRRGVSGLSTAGNPQRSGGRGGQGGAFCLLFGGPKSRSHAGAKSPHGPSQKATA